MSLNDELTALQQKLDGLKKDETVTIAALAAKQAEVDAASKHAAFYQRLNAVADDIKSGALNDVALMEQAIRNVTTEALGFLNL